jgi:hypothetical protein
LLLVHGGERGLAICSSHHLMTGALQPAHQHIPVNLVILYEKDDWLRRCHVFKPNTG